MRQRIITGVIFTILVAAFVIPSYWFPFFILLFALIVGALSTRELVSAVKQGGMEPSVPLIVIGCIIPMLILVISYFMKIQMTTALCYYLLIELLYAFAVAVLPSVMRNDGKMYLHDGLITSAIIIYVTFPLYCLCAVSVFPENGWFYLIPALFACWVSDTCAYFSGVTLGKHKIVPHISPKKTWEGCIGGALGCALAVMIYFDLIIYRLDDFNTNIFVFSILSFGLGLIMSVMSQLGDWVASLIKRRVGIKDFGNLFPGHGGIMDRFDSAFFTIPSGVLLALIAELFINH